MPTLMALFSNIVGADSLEPKWFEPDWLRADVLEPHAHTHTRMHTRAHTQGSCLTTNHRYKTPLFYKPAKLHNADVLQTTRATKRRCF